MVIKQFIDLATSTNAMLSERLQTESLPNGYTLCADFQSAGKGQVGNVWESEKGQNLLFSTLVDTSHIPIDKQFVISKIVSIVIRNVLLEYGIDAKIKYPNDIFVGDKKLAGILIENTVAGKKIKYSVVGIGLNVNQAVFNQNRDTAISMRNILNYCIQRDEILDRLTRNMLVEIANFKQSRCLKQYSQNLYRGVGYHWYEADGKMFEAEIVGVSDSGILTLMTDRREERNFGFKQVRFVV